MINDNGQFELLTLNSALTLILQEATTAGITVTTGSVEEQIAISWAQYFLLFDSSEFQTYQLQFNPVGSDIDLQNPGTPRLQAAIAQGPILLTNNTGSPIIVTPNSIFTAPNGNTYTIANASTTVSASGGTSAITVYSTVAGIDQNLPYGQSFTSSYDLTALNIQPFTSGRDIESDTNYIARIITLQTNNTSQQATIAAEKELNEFYEASLFYVNNSSNTLPDPIPVPPNGYICIVRFASGATPSSAELQNAFQILGNRFEFGNPYNASTDLHPVFSGVIYTGSFPQTYYLIAAQGVQSTIECSVSVKFAPNVDDTEKLVLAKAFAGFFGQNLLDYFSGAAGSININFQAIGSPMPSPVATTVPVLAGQGLISPIAPSFSIEQVRALISDKNDITQLPNLEYMECTALSYELDPLVMSESNITLDIDAPTGGTVEEVSFSQNAIFTDGTSWYDRYIYLDPALITVNVNEVLS